DRFSAAYLVAAAARAIREVAQLSLRAAKAKKRLATLTLEVEVKFATPGERQAFTAELAESVSALAARYHREAAEGGRRFRFLIGGYPASARVVDDSAEAVRME
ncbi:MAG: ArsR family transcriptional regulator, partial [Bryobacteraceae bacterium]